MRRMQGFVLLKNVDGVLPFSKRSKLAVIGPHTNATFAMLGNYHGSPAVGPISPCDGLASAATDVSCVIPVGCTVGGNVSCYDDAVAAAVEKADAVVIVVGLDQSQECEGKDRQDLAFPGTQLELIAAAAAAAKSPVTVLVMSGGAVDLSVLKANKNVGAIAWVGYPGQSGGTAIASALFGDTNRWGKLPVTWWVPLDLTHHGAFSGSRCVASPWAGCGGHHTLANRQGSGPSNARTYQPQVQQRLLQRCSIGQLCNAARPRHEVSRSDTPLLYRDTRVSLSSAALDVEARIGQTYIIAFATHGCTCLA